MNEVDHSDAVVVTDSHHSRLGDFWELNGFKMFAIKGGLIKDAQQLIEKINASIFVLHLGGNDLEVSEGAAVAENMQSLVKDIVARPSTRCVVTGQIIPRASRNPKFLPRYQEYEVSFKRASPKHHNWASDWCLDSIRQGIDKSVYFKDHTHLNSIGLDDFKNILEWVVMSINSDSFHGWSRPIVRTRQNKTDRYTAHWWF